MAQPHKQIDDKEPPRCPDCGAPMKLRTAKKGRNAGSQFYGCSRFSISKCKGTLPLDNQRGAPSDTTARSSVSLENFPRRVPATASSANTQAVLLECAAVPRSALSILAFGELPLPVTRSLAQWQLDLPLCEGQEPAALGTWFTVVEKILKRGRTVPLSKTLEDKLREIAGVGFDEPADEEQWGAILTSIAQSARPIPTWQVRFDSDEEQLFYSTVLPKISGHAGGWLMRQVALDSFNRSPHSEITNRLVDFVITHPSGVHLAIEIDGSQHPMQAEADEKRDMVLTEAGFEVVRIPADEIRRGSGAEIDRLNILLTSVPSAKDESPIARFVMLVRRAHQVQLALCQALAMGTLAPPVSGIVRVSVALDGGFDTEVTAKFNDTVLDDLNELISDVASLYGEKDQAFRFEPAETCDVRIVFDRSSVSRTPTLAVRDIYLPVTIASDVYGHASATATNVDKIVCERLLCRIFGFPIFREGQFEAIERCLRGQDAIVLLPTGAGKSVAFQLAALLKPGICIVIDPILSLIDDQIENLAAYGIDRTCQISSALKREERKAFLELFARGAYIFCYVAPERFQDQPFRNSLRILAAHTAVALVTIDEAHCVSEWGHDFRPAYLNIARTCRDFCATDRKPPPLMALTGTASRAVLKDVQRELQIYDFEAIITPSTFDREEIRFRVFQCRSDEKMLLLNGFLESLPRLFGITPGTLFDPCGRNTYSGLVFCLFVNGDYGVSQVSDELSKLLKLNIPYYSGSTPQGIQNDIFKIQKKRVAANFKRNRVALMTCTKAFGMGIDKPNIRYTVHYGLPPSIESFYQEAGRAGRNGRTAYCAILYSNDFLDRTKRLLNPSLGIENLRQETDEVYKKNLGDDITRALWFHTNAFTGIEPDFKQMLAVIEEIGDLTEARTVVIPFDREAKVKREERAVHRLLTIGVVADYTVDYSASEFRVRLSGYDKEQIADSLYRYIAAYQRGQAKVVSERIRKYMEKPHVEFVTEVGRELIQFVYEVIERSRRQALSEMLALCEECQTEDSIRERILNYLGQSVFTGAIEKILEAPEGGLTAVLDVLESVRASLDASQLRGESGRALESYPDHTGLRLLRAMSEAMTAQPKPDTITDNVEACVRFGVSKYGLKLDAVCEAVLSAIRISTDAKPKLAAPMIIGMIQGSGNERLVARRIIEELPVAMSEPAVCILMRMMNNRLDALFKE